MREQWDPDIHSSTPRPVTWASERQTGVQESPHILELWLCICLHQGPRPIPSTGPGHAAIPFPPQLLDRGGGIKKITGQEAPVSWAGLSSSRGHSLSKDVWMNGGILPQEALQVGPRAKGRCREMGSGPSVHPPLGSRASPQPQPQPFDHSSS